MVEVEIEFDPVGGTHQAELHFASAIAAMGEMLALQQSGFMAETMLMVPKAINAGVDYEMAGKKIFRFAFGYTFRTDGCGRHKLAIISLGEVHRVARNHSCKHMTLIVATDDN